jgi:hypothetical protein
MSKKFHDRFEIPVDIEEAKKRFVNRIRNRAFFTFFLNVGLNYYEILPFVADELGMEYESRINSDVPIEEYTEKDFHKTLQALEGFSKAIPHDKQLELEGIIVTTLSDSELDLGIRWERGRFMPSGARLLDEKLVNDPLHWLSDKKYNSVLEPFSKGLSHFLHAGSRPELLSDVVTDMYESLEALAKIITGRETKDLSANAESFIKAIKASDSYKNIVKNYIAYANNFRHAVKSTENKPEQSIQEVESFIYMTGIFIRLASQTT